MIMMRNRIIWLGMATLSLAACQSSDPVERQADAIEAAGSNRAQALETEAGTRAGALDDQAAGIAREATAVGGYAKRQLDVRAEALRSEANIIREQGRARADAEKAAADANAKALRAR
jgi:hypothetical protein